MTKKPDTASALAGILKAKRGEDEAAVSAPAVAVRAEPETPRVPTPALLPPMKIHRSPFPRNRTGGQFRSHHPAPQ